MSLLSELIYDLIPRSLAPPGNAIQRLRLQLFLDSLGNCFSQID